MHDITGLKFQESIKTSTLKPSAHYASNSAIMTENGSKIAKFEESRKKTNKQKELTQTKMKLKSKDATRSVLETSPDVELVDFETLSEIPATEPASSNRAIVLKSKCNSTPEAAVRQLFNTARFCHYKEESKAVIQVTHTETQCRLMLRRSEQTKVSDEKHC
jgi:hypothetical protein